MSSAPIALLGLSANYADKENWGLKLNLYINVKLSVFHAMVEE